MGRKACNVVALVLTVTPALTPAVTPALALTLVPKVDHPISSTRGKGSELILKCDSIHAECIVIFSMAFEGKVIFVSNLLNVLNTNTSLDAANGEARLVGKARHAATLEFQWGFFILHQLWLWPSHIVDHHPTIGRDHHHQIASHVQPVNTFGHIQGADRIVASSIPELQFSVPTPTNDEIAGRQKPHRTDGGIVNSNLLCDTVWRILS